MIDDSSSSHYFKTPMTMTIAEKMINAIAKNELRLPNVLIFPLINRRYYVALANP